MTVGPRGSQEIGGIDYRPSVSAEIFSNHPEATYWIGRVAMNSGDPNESEYFDALARFRANIYVKEMGFLASDKLDGQGRELDEFDDRSVHFCVIENVSEEAKAPQARIVGSGRMIFKGSERELLPIELQFPEIFNENPIGTNSAEVSRFIARHDNQFMQHAIALSVIRAMTHYSVNEGLGTNYCVVEKPLLKLLSKIGLPLEQIGPPKDVSEPGGIRALYPISIEPSKILDSVTKGDHDHIILRQFFENEIKNAGEGFYPEALIGGYND